MHAQRSHATYLAGRGAHYLFTVKRNQPGLFAGSHPCPGGRSQQLMTPARGDTAVMSAAPSSHRRRRWAGLPSRRPGHPDHAPPQVPREEKVVHRDRLRDHIPRRHPGQPR